MIDLSQGEIQVNKHLAHSSHLSKMLLPFYLSLRLHNPFTVSELSWLKFVKEKFKFT